MPDNSKKTIKDLPEDERPREKLLKFGADKLSDAELLAILIRTGTRGKSAIEMAEEILKSAGSTFEVIDKIFHNPRGVYKICQRTKI